MRVVIFRLWPWNGKYVFQLKPFISVFSGEHIGHGEFNQGQEDKHEARGHPDVNGLGVWDVRKWSIHTGTLCCHGEDGEYAQGYAARDGVHVEPEGDPGEHHYKDTGNVHLYQIVANVPGQREFYHQSTVITWKKNFPFTKCIPKSGLWKRWQNIPDLYF